VALRVNTSGDPSFEELLDRVRATDLAALAHRELPFEQVVELVNPERSLSFQPVVQVMLAFQVAEAGSFEVPGLDVWHHPVDLAVAKFDLCFKLTERFAADGSPVGIVGTVDYAVDVFSPAAAQEIAANLTGRLGGANLSGPFGARAATRSAQAVHARGASGRTAAAASQRRQ
jgi:non-ribosomal peptide synthetase component F